ncbi:MAG: hypothetical protein ACK5NT_09920 [Pyrinomonadaceae bacterium]
MYRPSYCCDCGEKIDRANWNLLTSRRFCELCETEHTFDTFLNRSVVGFAFIVGLIGIGAYMRVADVQPQATFLQQNPSEQTSKDFRNRNQAKKSASSAKMVAPLSEQESVERSSVDETVVNDGVKPKTHREDLEPVTESESEPFYFCGARTKKGKPCSRRVKGGGRCWQHKGQKAMVPEDKLRIE